MSNDDPRVRLLELDHQNATRIVDGALKILGIARGWSVTVWLALVASGIKLHNPWIAFLAIIPIAVLAVYDGYTSWVYRVALEHARRVERVWQAAYDAVGRGKTDEDVRIDAEAKLQSHDLGAILHFPRFPKRLSRKMLPAGAFWIVYLVLLVSAIGIGIGLAVTEKTASSNPHHHMIGRHR